CRGLMGLARGYSERGCRRHKSVGSGDQVEQPPDCGIRHLRSLGLTQHAAIHSELLPLAQPFVGDEEERPVRANGTAKRAAELVTLERWLRLVEEVARVETLVADELECFAMKLVAA